MKKERIILAAVLLLVLCLAIWFWFDSTYIILNGEVFKRSSVELVLEGEELPDQNLLAELPELEVLDVRAITLQPEEFDSLQAALPNCKILWQVPFGEGYHDNTATEVVATAVTLADLEQLKYLTNLETVDARGSRDYDVLMTLKEIHPELTVMYTVNIGGEEVRENVTSVAIGDGEAEQLLGAIPMLPELQIVDALDCTDYETLVAIHEVYPELDLQYEVPIGGESWAGTITQMTIENADGEELLSMLPYLPDLTDVTLTGTTPDNEVIYEMMCLRPDVIFHWDFELFGVQTSSTATELILSNIQMESTDEVENALKYFYNLERVEMCECGISSEDMDALWKRHPETRFVWTIHIGLGTLRTDATAFIPFKIGYNIDLPFYDAQITDLKYCVDMECLDLGHMRMTDISFLHYMPKLKYLILADTVAEDYSVVGELTELIYLELFRTPFSDVSLLLNLTKLQALNIGWTDLENPELLMELKSLKRLWVTMAGLTAEQNQQLKEALPDAVVYTTSRHPTEGGWRHFDLYYEMRDLLGMFYMD